MNYKVLIKQCPLPRRAAAIAEEVAKRCGAAPGEVWTVLTQEAICIKANADEREAMRLKEEFEAVGAEVEFVAQSPALPPVAVNDDDDNDEPGRVLTEEEFMERLKFRSDIFSVEKDGRMRKIEAACLVAGIASGMWMTKHEMNEVIPPDFYEKNLKEISVKVLNQKEIESVLQPQKPATKPVKEIHVAQAKTLQKRSSMGHGGGPGGGGSPYERVTKVGVLALISGKVVGKPIADADLFSQGGYQTGIDAIMQGVGALKSGGGGGNGRNRPTGIGFNSGYGPGLGGDGTGIDDIMNSLMSNGGAAEIALKPPAHKFSGLAILEPRFVPSVGGAIVGGRSRASVMRVVMQNLAALRYAYNKRLHEKPGLKGKVTCKFAIAETGKVIFCEMTGTTIDDPLLEAEVVSKIKTWVFEKIDKIGDVTEVVYPFAFSQ